MMNDVNNECVFDYDAFEVGESLIDHREYLNCQEKKWYFMAHVNVFSIFLHYLITIFLLVLM